jgi:hypothetical protein
MPWSYGLKNQLNDKQLKDVVQSLEQFFANPHFNRMRLSVPGGRTMAGTIAVPATSVQFDAETVLETPPDSITETEIADDSISTPKLQANSVVAAKIAAWDMEVGQYIRSSNYDPGVDGWAIDYDGDAEFNNVIVRGLYEAIGDDGELLQLRADGVLTGGPEMVLYTGSAVEDEPGAVHTARVDNTPAGHWELSTTIESPATTTSGHSYIYMRAVNPVAGSDYNTVTVHATQSAVYGTTSVVNATGSTPDISGMGMRIDDGVRMGFYRNTQSLTVEPYLALHDADNSIYAVGDIVLLDADTIMSLASTSVSLEVTGGSGIVAGTGGITLWQDSGDATDPYIVLNSSGIGIKAFTGEAIDLTVNSMALVVDDNQIVLTDGTNPWDVFSAWDAWNPTVTQGVAVNVTVVDAQYQRVGKRLHFNAAMTCTSSGTAATTIQVGGWPYSLRATGNNFVGNVFIGDVTGTATFYPGMIQVLNSTTVQFWRSDTNSNTTMGVSPSIQLQNTDFIYIEGTLELA